MPKERKSIEKLFKLVDALNNQVSNLEGMVKYLHRTLTEQCHSTNHKPDLVDKLIEDLTEVTQHVKDREIDLEEVTKHVKEGEENMERLTQIVKSFEQKLVVQTSSQQFGNMGFQNSVKKTTPTTSTGCTSSVDTPHPPPKVHFSQPKFRPRICYNCRRLGHIAKDCPNPNPKVYKLSEPPKTLPHPKSILKPRIQPNLSEQPKTQPANTLREKYASNLSEIPNFKPPQQPKVAHCSEYDDLSKYDPEWIKKVIAKNIKETQGQEAALKFLEKYSV